MNRELPIDLFMIDFGQYMYWLGFFRKTLIFKVLAFKTRRCLSTLNLIRIFIMRDSNIQGKNLYEIIQIMGKNRWSDDDESLDWGEIEKVTRNFKGSADEIEDLLIDEIRPNRKKKKRQERYYDDEG